MDWRISDSASIRVTSQALGIPLINGSPVRREEIKTKRTGTEGKMASQQVFPKLLEAFEQDHVMLGRGFNQLSCCLRAGDPTGACAAARRLCEEAGAHIGFEEEGFYPALVPLLG
jgi:hypothetical protein